MSTDREIVEAATPGPWEYKEVERWADCAKSPDIEYYAFMQKEDDAETGKAKNAQFIAHFNPSKVSSMLDRIEALEKENERLKEERLDFENREGAICPEDVGFEEYIRHLQKRVEELETSRDWHKKRSEGYYKRLDDAGLTKSVEPQTV